MIKTVLKLALAAAILNAAYQAGSVAWDHFALRDEAQQLILFGSSTSTTELHNRILQKATELGVPLLAENLTVRRDGVRTIAEAHYTRRVEYFPNQTYPLNFSFSVDALSMQSLDGVSR